VLFKKKKSITYCLKDGVGGTKRLRRWRMGAVALTSIEMGEEEEEEDG